MPEAETMSELVTRLKSDWAARDNQIENMRKLRFMENDLQFPQAVEPDEVRAPIGHQIVERMTGTLTADPITITVPPASEKTKSQEQSSKMEKFALAGLEQLERQSDADVSDRFVETLIADGHGCMRMLYAPQLKRRRPKKRKKESAEVYEARLDGWKRGRIPISWQWLDPLTVFPVWGELGLTTILEVDDRDVLTLDSRRWNVAKPDLWELSKLKHGDTGAITFQQRWTEDTLTYAVEGEIVHTQKHRYGSVPYAYAVGLGAASTNPKYMGYSVLYPIRSLMPYLDRLLSQKGTAIRMWCWPTIVFKSAVKQAGTDPQAIIRQIEIGPGKPVSIYQDEDITFLTWQGNGPDLDEQIKLIMSMMERAGFGDTMYGQSTGDSGYAISQLVAAARMRYKPIVAHAERALAQQVVTLFDIVEYQIGLPVHVFNYKKKGGWVTIKPDDLLGYRQIKVKLNPLMPTDTYARSSQALNENRGGLRSVRGSMEMIGIEQPDDEMRAIRADRWMARPEIDTYMTQQAVKRLGLQLAKGDMTMGRLQGAYPDMPEQLQNVLGQQMEQTAPQGYGAQDLGMGQQQQGMPGGQQQQQMPPEIKRAIEMLAQRYNVSPQQMLQQLVSMARRMNITVMQLIQMLMQRQNIASQRTMSTPRGGAPGQAGGRAGQTYRPTGPQVMAQPGMRAQPPTPHVGPITRPSGIATGRAPGTKRR